MSTFFVESTLKPDEPDILKYCMQIEVDEDIFLEDITRSHVTRLKKIIERWPNRYSTRLKQFSIAELCNMLEKANKSHLPQLIQDRLLDTISLATMINYSSPLRNTVEQAKEDAIVDINVFEHFNYKKTKKYRKSKEGKPFTAEELASIFGTKIHTEKIFDAPYKFWVPILLLYSGARLNDICNLKISDITTIGDIKCLRIEKSKTDAGKRNVPIHSLVIKLGFLEFVDYKKTQGSKYIFDELPEYTTPSGTLVTRGNTVGKWFNIKKPEDPARGHLDKCGITEKGKRLHSFRNTFINHLKQQRIQLEEVKEVVGHVSDDMTFATYAEPYQISILKQVVENINYRGIKLPWLTNKHYLKIKFPWDKQERSQS